MRCLALLKERGIFALKCFNRKRGMFLLIASADCQLVFAEESLIPGADIEFVKFSHLAFRTIHY